VIWFEAPAVAVGPPHHPVTGRELPGVFAHMSDVNGPNARDGGAGV
jgi:hypothetical protein